MLLLFARRFAADDLAAGDGLRFAADDDVTGGTEAEDARCCLDRDTFEVRDAVGAAAAADDDDDDDDDDDAKCRRERDGAADADIWTGTQMRAHV